MRDRLIDLLIETPCNADYCAARDCGRCGELDKLDRCQIEAIADYLLASGVVVIQCNIGDTVYQTDGIRIYELEILDVSLRKNKPYYETESIDFDESAIGKTVFLTREEAEQKLKEGKG